MTERQLAALLRQLAARVRAVAEEIEPLIESGAMVEIKEPDWENGVRTVLGVQLPTRTTTTTRPAAVQRVLDLADEIDNEAELLTLTPTT